MHRSSSNDFSSSTIRGIVAGILLLIAPFFLFACVIVILILLPPEITNYYSLSYVGLIIWFGMSTYVATKMNQATKDYMQLIHKNYRSSPPVLTNTDGDRLLMKDVSSKQALRVLISYWTPQSIEVVEEQRLKVVRYIFGLVFTVFAGSIVPITLSLLGII